MVNNNNIIKAIPNPNPYSNPNPYPIQNQKLDHYSNLQPFLSEILSFGAIVAVASVGSFKSHITLTNILKFKYNQHTSTFFHLNLRYLTFRLSIVNSEQERKDPLLMNG